MTSNELQQLYNTLLLIETKGQSTLYLSDCLKWTSQKIEELKKNEETEKVSGRVE